MSQIVVTPDGKRHVFPDGASPEQIKAALAGYAKPGANWLSAPLPQPTMAGGGPEPTSAVVGEVVSPEVFWSGVKGRGLGLLPTAGGMAGGLVGGALGAPGGPVGVAAGAIAGATVGGAAGEAARQGLSGAPLSAGGIASQGAQQGAYEAIGGAIGAGAGRLAKPVMRRALGVGKTLLRDFPNAVETTIAKGIPVTSGGVAKAVGLRRESSEALQSLLREAEATGVTFRAEDLVRNANELLASKVLPTADKARIAKQVDAFLAQHGGADLSPTLVKQLKQFYQTRAKSIYRGSKTGVPTLAQQNRALFSGNVATGAKQALETIPGVAQREATTQSLIGAEKAVSDAFMRPAPQLSLMHPRTWPVVGTLGSPAVTSHAALMLASPWFRNLARQSPRAAAALLSQLGAQDSTSQEGDFLSQPVRTQER